MTSTAHEKTYGDAFAANAAENYQRFFVPAIGGPLAADLVAQANLKPGDRVLDVACGTGVVARLAAERVGRGGSVAGADSTPGMLAVARRLPSAQPVRWYETSAEAMPLPDEAFDVVFCQLALQFMADKAAAVREMRRVLVPGGRAYVSVPAPTPFWNVVDQVFERAGLPAAAAFVRLVFSLHEPDELERLFRNADFGAVNVQTGQKRFRLPAAQEFLWQDPLSTPLAGAVQQLPAETRAAIEREVVGQWQPWSQDDGLVYEHPMLVATATR